MPRVVRIKQVRPPGTAASPPPRGRPPVPHVPAETPSAPVSLPAGVRLPPVGASPPQAGPARPLVRAHREVREGRDIESELQPYPQPLGALAYLGEHPVRGEDSRYPPHGVDTLSLLFGHSPGERPQRRRPVHVALPPREHLFGEPPPCPDRGRKSDGSRPMFSLKVLKVKTTPPLSDRNPWSFSFRPSGF